MMDDPEGYWMPLPKEPKNDDDECDPDCEHYDEIWDEKELNEELAKDEDKEAK